MYREPLVLLPVLFVTFLTIRFINRNLQLEAKSLLFLFTFAYLCDVALRAK